MVLVPLRAGSSSTSSTSRSCARWTAPAIRASSSSAESLVGRLVEAAELADRGGRGDVAAGRAADAVADGEQPRPGVPGVLVVAAHPADVGDGAVVEAQARQRRGRLGRLVGHPGLLPELEDRLADADLGAHGDRGRLGDPHRADEGAVGGAEILDEPLVAGGRDPGVSGGDVVVVEPDRRVAAAADQDRARREVGALADVGALGRPARGWGRCAACSASVAWAPSGPCRRRCAPPRAPARRTCRSGSPRSPTARRSRGSPGRRPG